MRFSIAVLRATAASLALILLALPGTVGAQTQTGSPVKDVLTKAKNALNDVRYHDADSLARAALAYGNLLSREEQLSAVQIRVAALYPEDAADQKLDSAMALIRQMIGLGAKTMPRDISWAGLDTVVARALRASQPAKVVLGSRIAGAVVFVGNDLQGVIQGLRTVLVPPEVPVKISVRADKCTQWDTTITVRAADSVRIGYRNPVCPP